MTKIDQSPQKSTSSRVGVRAREQLLDVAGPIFAEKGFDRATSREICETAGMNVAAVNYHFGGIDALYAEVWTLANRRLLTISAAQDIATGPRSPYDKLLAYLKPIIEWLAHPGQKSWEMRLLCRELISPSPMRHEFTRRETLPKIKIGLQILAELMATTPDDPAVGRTLLMVIAPCLLIAMADRTMLETMLPGHRHFDPELLIQHYERFIRAGLEAVIRAPVHDNLR